MTVHKQHAVPLSLFAVTLSASAGLAGQMGISFYGPDQVSVPFGDGFRWVAPDGLGLVRLYPPCRRVAAAWIRQFGLWADLSFLDASVLLDRGMPDGGSPGESLRSCGTLLLQNCSRVCDSV